MLSLAAALLVTMPTMAEDPAPHDVFETWLVESGSAKVEITDCGDGSPCGRIVWVDPADLQPGAMGTVLRDEGNPDPSLRDRPIIGLPLIYGFDRAKDGWRRGKIYDADNGDIYRAAIFRDGPDQLRLKGCAGPFCKEQTWKRAPLTATQRAEAAQQTSPDTPLPAIPAD